MKIQGVKTSTQQCFFFIRFLLIRLTRQRKVFRNFFKRSDDYDKNLKYETYILCINGSLDSHISGVRLGTLQSR